MSESTTPTGPDFAAGVAIDAVHEGTPIAGTWQGEAVLLARRGDEWFAIGAQCTHYGGPLADGLQVDDTVRCPWHHACFSLRTGEALRAPALNPVACYAVERRGDRVFVTAKRAQPGSVRRRVPRPDAPATIAIVGAGAAGNSCAEELRHLGFAGSITCIDPDDGAPYDRPNLSKDYLAGNAPEEWIPLHPRDHYETLGIELLLGRGVTRLDAAAKRLTLDDGTTRAFDAIVLATGAVPVAPELAGAGGPPVLTLRSLRDSRAIIAAATGARRVVVLGASFIGLEVAAALRTRGLEVHVVAPAARPLERVLGAAFGDFVRALHESHGVAFHLGRRALRVEPGAVVLDDGTRLPADFVVAGIGVVPETRLAAAAGLRVDDGILVDGFLHTSAPAIYAAGDAARYPDARHGGLVRIEHWVHSQRMGQAVARNLAGERAAFTDVPFFWSQHYDVGISYVGHAERWDRIDIDGDLGAHDCVARFRAGDRVLAVASIYRDHDSLRAELAMERGTSLG